MYFTKECIEILLVLQAYKVNCAVKKEQHILHPYLLFMVLKQLNIGIFQYGEKLELFPV